MKIRLMLGITTFILRFAPSGWKAHLSNNSHRQGCPNFITDLSKQINKPKFLNVSFISAYSLRKFRVTKLLIDDWHTHKLVFAVCLLVVSLVVFLHSRYRRMERITKKLFSMEKNSADLSLRLQSLKDEKDWLVEEIHHRVKNNLQIVVSLLYSQSAYLTNPEALQAIQNSQRRMYAIALIHQKLYQTESLSSINMEIYINELIQYLQDEYQSTERVGIVLHTIPLKLDVASAIPLGLIINEAICNTLQYAFPRQANGEITLTLDKDDQENYLLEISDNGIGLPPGFDINKRQSLGTSLMIGLSRQLKAKLDIKNINGVAVTLRFKDLNPENLHLSL